MLWVYFTLLASPSVWLLFVFLLVGGLLPDYALKAGHEAFGLRVHSVFPGDNGRPGAAPGEKRERKLFSIRRPANRSRRPAQWAPDLENVAEQTQL